MSTLYRCPHGWGPEWGHEDHAGTFPAFQMLCRKQCFDAVHLQTLTIDRQSAFISGPLMTSPTGQVLADLSAAKLSKDSSVKSKRRSASASRPAAELNVPVMPHKKVKLVQEQAAGKHGRVSQDATAQSLTDQPAASPSVHPKAQRRRKRARASTEGLTEDEISRRERQRELQVQKVFATSRQLPLV